MAYLDTRAQLLINPYFQDTRGDAPVPVRRMGGAWRIAIFLVFIRVLMWLLLPFASHRQPRLARILSHGSTPHRSAQAP